MVLAFPEMIGLLHLYPSAAISTAECPPCPSKRYQCPSFFWASTGTVTATRMKPPEVPARAMYLHTTLFVGNNLIASQAQRFHVRKNLKGKGFAV